MKKKMKEKSIRSSPYTKTFGCHERRCFQSHARRQSCRAGLPRREVSSDAVRGIASSNRYMLYTRDLSLPRRASPAINSRRLNYRLINADRFINVRELLCVRALLEHPAYTSVLSTHGRISFSFFFLPPPVFLVVSFDFPFFLMTSSIGRRKKTRSSHVRR